MNGHTNIEFTNLTEIKLTYTYPIIKYNFLNKNRKHEKLKRKRKQLRIIIWKMILQYKDGICEWFLLADENEQLCGR